MKNKFTWAALPAFLIIFSCLCISSCENNNAVLSLNRVDIPEYEIEDYCNLLDDKNPQLVYSAICKLIPHADDMSLLLSKAPDAEITDTSKGSGDSSLYILASRVYTKISALLYSGNERIVCASLRFMSEFGKKYTSQHEIADKLLKVDMKTEDIKLEYINALVALYSVNPAPFEPVLKKLINSESWLVSRFAYQYLPFFKNNEFLDYIKVNYNSSAEYEKLLLLSCIADSCNDQDLDFLLSEIKTETQIKVKRYLGKSLGKAANIERVNNWIIQNSSCLKDIQDEMTNHYIYQLSHPRSIQILYAMFKANLVSDSAFYGESSSVIPILYGVLGLENKQERDSASEGTLQYYESIEKQIELNPVFNKHWLAYKESYSPMFTDAFLNAHQALYVEFIRKSRILFDETGIDSAYKNHWTKAFDQTENGLRKATAEDYH